MGLTPACRPPPGGSPVVQRLLKINLSVVEKSTFVVQSRSKVNLSVKSHPFKSRLCSQVHIVNSCFECPWCQHLRQKSPALGTKSTILGLREGIRGPHIIQYRIIQVQSIILETGVNSSLLVAYGCPVNLTDCSRFEILVSRYKCEPHSHSVINSRLVGSTGGTTRAKDAQETPTQSRISPSILVYAENAFNGRTHESAWRIIQRERESTHPRVGLSNALLFRHPLAGVRGFRYLLHNIQIIKQQENYVIVN